MRKHTPTIHRTLLAGDTKMATIEALRNELEEATYALEEARKDVMLPRSYLTTLEAEVATLHAQLESFGVLSAADEEEEEVPQQSTEPAEDEEDPAAEQEPAEEDDGFFDEDEASEIIDSEDEISADDLDEEEPAQEQRKATPENVVAMPAKLRRELGDVNADMLDEYAAGVRKKVVSFFKMLRQHLDMGEVNESDGNQDLIETLLDEVGKKGVAKIRLHFPEWREFIMRQLAKDMVPLFRADEPDLAEEIAVRVPVKDRAEVVDGVNQKAKPSALNAPPSTPARPRAQPMEPAPVAASVAPVSAAATPVLRPAQGRVSYRATDLAPGRRPSIKLS
jgi:hypothetical protein